MALTLRLMTPGDIELGMRLKGQAGWNQTPTDWQRFLELEPNGCFVAEWDGRPVATTTTCTFGSVGWVGMVLVDESFRHRGIATQLVGRALEYLDERGVRTMRLDATKFGRPVYERVGFVAEHDFIRFEGIAHQPSGNSATSPAGLEQLGFLVDLDQRATGSDRECLLMQLVKEDGVTGRVVCSGDSIAGYLLLRPGSSAIQIGPGVALTEEAGRSLADWALGHCAGQRVFIDIPLDNRPATEWAVERGLGEQRRFSRMFRGQPVGEDVSLIWASSGPEKG